MRKATKELALCSMLAALSVVVLCLGGIVPFAVYACPMLASGALLLVREECRPSYAWCCWAAVAILALLLGPDKEASALYLFLGWYPLLQPKLDAEEDDLQFAMTAYGLCVLLEAHSETEKADALRQKLLVRDGFWFCFSYLNN